MNTLLYLLQNKQYPETYFYKSSMFHMMSRWLKLDTFPRLITYMGLGSQKHRWRDQRVTEPSPVNTTCFAVNICMSVEQASGSSQGSCLEQDHRDHCLPQRLETQFSVLCMFSQRYPWALINYASILTELRGSQK